MRVLLFVVLFIVIGLKFEHTSAFEPPIEDSKAAHRFYPPPCIDGLPCQYDRHCKRWPRGEEVCAPTDYISDKNRLKSLFGHPWKLIYPRLT